MRYDSGQFGSFDGRDNRKSVMQLFVLLGEGLPDWVGDNLRAGFLRGLVQSSDNGFADSPVRVEPCGAIDAYKLFVAITGCLGVDIDRAACALEEVVRRRDEFLAGVIDDEGSLRPVR